MSKFTIQSFELAGNNLKREFFKLFPKDLIFFETLFSAFSLEKEWRHNPDCNHVSMVCFDLSILFFSIPGHQVPVRRKK